METAEQAPETQATPGEERLISATARRLFRFSEFLHVGDGAEQCAVALFLSGGGPLKLTEAPQCDSPEGHVHVWCRLPNPYQHREIREKSLAAQARRIRQLKDPNCDAYEILEAELDALIGAKELIIEELLVEEYANDYPQAIQAVEDDERFQHIDHDRERYLELMKMEEAERPADEYEELTRHVNAYVDAVQAKLDETQGPRREALGGLDEGELINQIREKRIAGDAEEMFLHTYAMHEHFVGTYALSPVGIDKRPTTLYFASVDAMKDSATELIEALQATFADLSRAMQQGSMGNS